MSGKKNLLLVFLFIPCFMAFGQETPLHPISGKIFSPFVFNPAIAGSKDFTSVDLSAALQNRQYTQILTGNARLMKKSKDDSGNSGIKQFTNIGLGGYLFNDLIGDYRNAGISITGAYHIPLGKEKLSFLSIGAAAKGIFNHYPGNTDMGKPERDTIFPNVDAGIYFYNPSFYAGISANNLLSKSQARDTIPVSEEYFFNAGFKVVLSRNLNIVLEPFIIASTGDSLPDKISDMIHPGLKLYLGNFCMGSYLNDYDKIPFFFQYKYPGFYIGSFFELPRNTPFYKKGITTEIVLGLNIAKNNPAYNRKGQW